MVSLLFPIISLMKSLWIHIYGIINVKAYERLRFIVKYKFSTEEILSSTFIVYEYCRNSILN